MDIQSRKQELFLSCERLVNEEKNELEIKIKDKIEKQITKEIEEYIRKTRIHISKKV